MKKSHLLFLLPFCLLSLTGCPILKNLADKIKSKTPDYEEVSYETFQQEAQKAHLAGHSYTTAVINGYLKNDTDNLFFSSDMLYFDDGEWVTADGSVTEKSEIGVDFLRREAYTVVDDGKTQYYFGKKGFKMTIDTETTDGTAKFNTEGLLTDYSVTFSKTIYSLSFSYKTNSVDILRRVDYSIFHDSAVTAHEKGHSYTKAVVNGTSESRGTTTKYSKVEFVLTSGVWQLKEISFTNLILSVYVGREACSVTEEDDISYYSGNGFKISVKNDTNNGYALFNKKGLLIEYKVNTYDESSGDSSRMDISITYSR